MECNARKFIPIYTYINNVSTRFQLLIDENGSIYVKCGLEKKKVYIARRPKYYDYKVNGKNAYEIANIEAVGHLAVTTNHFCIHFHEKEQCKFCSIESWTDNNRNSRNEMLEVIEMAYKSGEVSHISLTTGTVNKKDKGIKGMLAFIMELKNRNINVDIACEFEPVEDLTLLDELYNYGVKTVSCNIKVVEEEVRKFLMPGKGMLDKKLYYKNWSKVVEVLGLTRFIVI